MSRLHKLADPATSSDAAAAPPPPAKPGRAGKVNLSARISPALHRDIRMLAIEQGIEMQQLVIDAMNARLAHFGKRTHSE